MSNTDTFGKVSVFTNEVHWIIPNFYDLPQECGTRIGSIAFCFAGQYWSMAVLTNGSYKSNSNGWFGMEVYNTDYTTRFRVIQLGVIGKAERNFVKSRAEMDAGGWYKCTHLLTTSLLKSSREIMVPDGNLHVFFNIENEKDDSTILVPFLQFATEDAEEWFKEKLKNDDTEASSQTEEKNEKEEPKQHPLDVCPEVPTETQKENGMKKLSKDFGDILINENISDVVLKVQDQEFKAHRCILAARSPVFLAMMTHETKEKISGVVDIPDVDSKTFADFLNYLYTGYEQNVTPQNCVHLYTTADKYQVSELKETCLDHMMSNISIDNFCDVLTLSLQHDERFLKDACLIFFLENSLDIILTCKWQTFLTENPIIGNELFIRHIKCCNRQKD